MLNTARRYQGSSKNVLLPGDGHAVFEFTDRYSIFDWGEMPDLLSGKGEALALAGDLFFQHLAKRGVPHHSLGLVDERGEATTGPTRFLKVQAVEVIRPTRRDGNIYDYAAYQEGPTNCLVPLEVIFRWGAPAGSSLLKRHPELKEGARFPRPLVEFTTKLEHGDRPLTAAEAQQIAGLTAAEMNRLTELTITAATHLRDVVALLHGELWDGKFEWAFRGAGAMRDFVMVDAIGLDELRVTFQGRTLSKEFLRAHYRGSDWEKALNEAKKIAAREGGDFKEICATRLGQTPAPLPAQAKLAAETMYRCFTNDLHQLLTGKPVYEPHLTLPHWFREFP